MALKRYEKYPNRWSPATPEQPQGAFKNRTTSVSKDGSYIEKDWANDWSGFFGAALGKAGIVPNGEVDTALSSQYYEAFRTFFYNPENKPDPVDIGAADRSHGHQIANVNGLQSALDSKSANGHKHDIADVISLQATLDAKYRLLDGGSADCNTHIKEGHYNINQDAANWCSPGVGGSMLVLRHGSDNYVNQLAAVGSASQWYVRNKSGSTWSPWERIYAGEFKPTYTASEVGAAPASHTHSPDQAGAYANSSTPVTDCDAEKKAGHYTVTASAKNWAFTGYGGSMLVTVHGGEYINQIAIVAAGNLIATRSKNGSTWSSWKQLYSEDNKPPADGVGYGQKWQDVKDVRKLNTTYTNTTTKPIMVSISSESVYAQQFYTMLVDDVVVSIGGVDANVSKHIFLSSIVPAGSTYKISSTVDFLFKSWAELR